MTGTRTPARGAAGSRLGRWLWLIQPSGIACEYLTAAFVAAPYSFLHNTISDLGATTCTTIPYPLESVAVCSHAHPVLNGSFIALGLALAVGALLLRRSFPASPLRGIATALWVISGLSTMAVGLVPLDRDLELHVIVAIPAFFLQPPALFLHSILIARSRGRRWWALGAVGVGTLLLAIWFHLRLETEWGGLIERLALWPIYFGLAALALALPRIGAHTTDSAR